MIKRNYGSGSASSSMSSKLLYPTHDTMSSSYTSPYSGYSRYQSDYNSQRYTDITPYATPINYARVSRGPSLSRGSSLQDVGPKPRRIPRQASLETESPSVFGARKVETRQRSSGEGQHYTEMQRRMGAMLGRQESGRGEQKRSINCNKICTGIIIGNGETVCDLDYLKSVGATHVLNTAEQHVQVSQARYASRGINYYGFHVDDLPHCNISRYFHRSTEFIDRAVTGGGLVVVNCYMGLSRSASVVIAYLMTKHNMSFQRALDFVKKSRGVRPNEGFVRQLRDLEFSLQRKTAAFR